jgi:hypothetical protein
VILVVVPHAVVYVPRRLERLGKVYADGAVTVGRHAAFIIGDVGDAREVVLTTTEPTRTVRRLTVCVGKLKLPQL